MAVFSVSRAQKGKGYKNAEPERQAEAERLNPYPSAHRVWTLDHSPLTIKHQVSTIDYRPSTIDYRLFPPNRILPIEELVDSVLSVTQVHLGHTVQLCGMNELIPHPL
jgi:hypothetical protein